MAIKLSNGHFKAAANALNIHPAIVKTVAMNESLNAGIDEKGRPIILFERHKFWKYVGEILGVEKRNEIAKAHPDICNRDAGGYGKAGEHQWKRFSKAFRICKQAAMLSCSWGSFQEMGFNFKQIGFDSVDQFVDAIKLGLEAHLVIFIVSIRKKGLLKFLQKREPDFHNFAEGYNGPNQEKNDYEGKMQRGYKKYLKEDWDSVVALPLVTIADLKKRTIRLTEMLDANNDGIPDDQQVPATVPATEPTVDSSSESSGDSGLPAPVEDLNANNQSEPVPDNSQPPVPEENKPVELPQVKAEDQPEKAVSGIGASIAAAVTFVTTTLGGVLTWLAGAKTEIIYGFFGAAAIVGTVFIIKRFSFANEEKQREHDAKMKREQWAHDLQIEMVKAAADKNLNTVVIKPTEQKNSEPETPAPLASFARSLTIWQRLTGRI